MSYVREHEAANAHPLTLAGLKKAERVVKAAKAADRRKAQRLRKKAEKLAAEASELEWQANRYSESDTRYAKLRSDIEEAAYWAAREALGTFERDANGDYVEPAPFWRVMYGDEHLGDFQAEERVDVLRSVCPRDDPRSWGDFEVTRIPA